MRRSRIKAKPRRGGAMPEEVYRLVMQRSGYRCEANLRGVCAGDAAEWHHRQPRDRYNDVPSNGLALCAPCHRFVTDVSPSTGFELGLRISRHTMRPAREFPVFLRGREWVLLDDDGSYALYIPAT